MLTLGGRIKKLILIRLLFGALLLYAPRVFQESDPSIFYLFSLTVCTLSLFYALWMSTQRRVWQLGILQIYFDVPLETFLLIFTGGAESVFAVFYVLTILSAALVLGEKRPIRAATLFSCLGYLIGSFIAFKSGIHFLILDDPIYFSYTVLVRIVIFFCVGRLSLYWGQTVLELQTRMRFMERLSLLGEVVSKVAHETRNPLSAIRTASEVLKDTLRGKLNPPEEKLLTVIEGESQRLVQTVERILGYTKEIRPDPKILLLDSLIERTLSVLRLRFKENLNGMVVEKKYEPSEVHVYADEEQILGALLNLLVNAYEAMSGKGVLRIRASEDTHGTKIDIEDNGPGIPPDRLKELFSPFKSSKKGGTGLGLAEVHKIVTLHEGKIEAESLPGKGATFHLYFPKI